MSNLNVNAISPQSGSILRVTSNLNITGNVTASGDFLGQSTSTGSFGELKISGAGQEKISLLGGTNQFINFGDADDYNIGAIKYIHSSTNQMQFITNNTMGFFITKNQDIGMKATGKFYFDGGYNTFFEESSADNVKFTIGGVEILDITETGVSGSSTSTGSFGQLQIDGKIGVGTTSNLKSQLHIYRDDSITHTPSQTDGQKGLLIEQDGTGDAVMEFLTTGVTNYVMGIDNSDSDAFKITKGQFRLGDGSVHFRYGPTGILTLEGTSARLGIGTNNTQANLHVVGSGLITTNLEVQGNISGSSTSTGSFGAIQSAGNITPKTDDSVDLGSADLRFQNVFTTDLQLNNEGTSGNEVDGTTGSWTIQEGDEELYLLNRKSGKKYKFKLEEIG